MHSDVCERANIWTIFRQKFKLSKFNKAQKDFATVFWWNHNRGIILGYLTNLVFKRIHHCFKKKKSGGKKREKSKKKQLLLLNGCLAFFAACF